MILLSLIFGLICGLALGITGGGGSVLAVPMLIYGLGLNVSESITISLLVVGLSSLFGLCLRLKSNEIVYPVALIFAVSGFAFVPIGAHVSNLIADNILLYLFASLMVIIGIWSWIKSSVDMRKSTNNLCRFDDNGKIIMTRKAVIIFFNFRNVYGGFNRDFWSWWWIFDSPCFINYH